MKPKHPVQIEIETKIRSQHKKQSTADAYWGWVKRYFDFCSKNKLAAICSGVYNAGQKLDWRLAVEVLWVIMRGSYAAPILDRYANPHVLPSKIGVLEISFSQGF